MKLEVQLIGKEGVHVFCNVKINGVNGRAIIDTGASESVLNQAALTKFSLMVTETEDENLLMGINPGESKLKVVRIERLSIGKFEIRELFLSVIDMKHLLTPYKRLKIKPFDLILGGDVLFRGKAVINYKREQLTFS